MSGTSIEKRNVIVLGKTGAGKSSVGNALIGKYKFEVKGSVSSVTTGTEVKVEEFYHDETKYVVKVIDTVGLFDTGGALSNDKIMTDLKTNLMESVPEGVSLVLFVMKEGRFTQEEKNVFDIIIKEFTSDISEMSALVITNCDAKGSAARQGIISTFRNDTTTKQTAEFMKKGVFAVGFPDLDTMDEDEKPLYSKKMQKDRDALQQLVFESGKMRLASKLFDPTADANGKTTQEDFIKKVEKVSKWSCIII